MKLGKIYRVTFKDHVQGDGTLTGPMDFTAYGKLVDETDDSYLIEYWTHADAGHLSDMNSGRLCILKSAVLSTKELK